MRDGGLWLVFLTLMWTGLDSTAQATKPTESESVSLVQATLGLDLTVDYNRPAIIGTATLTLANNGSGPVREVPLLLNQLMSIRGVTDDHQRRQQWTSVISIFEDDPFPQVVATTVELAQPVPPGGRIVLRVNYEGPLVGYTETGSFYIKDRIDQEFTIIRSDALAFPIVGVTSRTANRAMKQEPFDFEARISVPAEEVVATGGELRGREVAGSRAVYSFAGRQVPFLNIAIAPYKVAEEAGIRVYALPADAARAGIILDAGRQALTRLEGWYGPLATKPRVTVIEIPEGFGSQASATAGIILDAAAFKDKAQLPQFYHELSHFWNPPDLDVPSPRWNEGLAMYLQFRLAREIDGFAGTSATIERARSRVCAAEAKRDLARVPFARFGAEGRTDFAYTVGFLMFSGLETLMGESDLDRGFRQYVQAHQGKGGTTADLLAALSGASGSKATSAFLHDWMETTEWIGPVCDAPTFSDALARWR